MDGLDYWRLCDELSVTQAALLICGFDPAGEMAYAEDWETHQRPPGYEGSKTALSNALRKESIKGLFVPEFEHDINGNRTEPIEGSIDVNSSRIEVESLRSWMRAKGFSSGFFFPQEAAIPDYLNPHHPRYAKKLAAIVLAWQAVEDTRGKSPKNALIKWLREHAAEFGLSDEEGKPNEQGIDECAKAANWQPGGGAPKTPAA